MSGLDSAVAGRRVLLTGASGFIGRRLAARLHDLGAELHAASRAGAGDEVPGRWWRADLTDPVATAMLVDAVRPDAILHLAARVTGTRATSEALSVLHQNLLATIHLLAAAEGRGCRVVLAGSMEEPGPSDPATAVPASPYAAAKWAASAHARMWHALGALDVVVLRVFMVYGPGRQDTTKLVPYAITTLLEGREPELSSGARAVDWVYVDDVVEAFVSAAAAPGVAGRTFDVGSGERVTIRQLVERLVQIVDPALSPRFGALADRPLERTPVADVAPSAAALGWRPRVSLDEGLERTVEWFRAGAGSG